MTNLTSNPAATSAPDEPIWMSTLFPNTGYVRLWRAVVRLFLSFGVLAAGVQIWKIAGEIEARNTWPASPGKIVSSQIEDDSDMRGKTIDRRHTHFWVEYEVTFAVAEDQCRTGIFNGGPPNSLPCVGKVRTRSTRSSHEARRWMNERYGSDGSITVLHNPSGPEIKIAGSSIWLFYGWTNTALAAFWLIGWWFLHAFLQRRLDYLQRHPEAETNPSNQTGPDKYELTDLDLS